MLRRALQEDYWMQSNDIYFNSVCYTMLGYEPNELPQTVEAALSLIHPDDFASMRDSILQHVRQGTLFDHEVRMRTKGGEWRWINTRGKVVEKDDSGLPVRFIGTHQDITERKRAKERLIAAKQEAEAANAAKSLFLANMSHEIRTPLNGILGMLQLIQSFDLEDELNEYINTAISSSRHLSELLRNILDLSRVEADNFE